MHEIYELKNKDTDRKVSLYIQRLWNEDKIDELLLLIDINKNFKVGLSHIPEFIDPEKSECNNFTFNKFFQLVEKLKVTEDNDKKYELIENAAIECDEVVWNEIYKIVLTNKLETIINVNAIVKTLEKLLTKGK